MFNNIDGLLEDWLEIEYYHIANQLGFIKEQRVADEELIKDTVRCLDYLTSRFDGDSDNYIITIIALMWEHTDKKHYQLQDVILHFLSRIGYSTSAIMIDDNYKYDNKLFKPLSLLDTFSIIKEQQKYEIEINDETFLLTKFQKQIWDKIGDNRCTGISAPTSAGKSFVILLRTLFETIDKDTDIVYIVPTLSLLNQVTEDYHRYVKKLKLENYRITSTYSPLCDKKSIYVMTQEKAVAAFSQTEGSAFEKSLIFVVDEIQNIERLLSPGDDRAKVLFDTLMEFSVKSNVEKIIVSGPRVKKLDKLGITLFGNDSINIETKTSPVLNLTYSISNIKDLYYFKQYCTLNNSEISHLITNPNMICGYGKKFYNSEFLDYLNEFIDRIGKHNQNIVFSPTTSTARRIATSLSGTKTNDNSIKSLIDYYKETINENYSLCNTLKSGVAYHHSKLPTHVRRTLEKAISDKRINTVVCTTTLMQGVNLPAQNIIIRNPHLYIQKRKTSEELSAYEMANLRGRAGRLLKDFIGRTYALDESQFIDVEEYEQTTLFEDAEIELPTGYGDKYNQFKEIIESVASSDSPIDGTMNEYGYLVTYIRQTILRHKENATTKLNNVGISYTPEQVAAIILKLSSLEVPKEICLKNRYWDPFILNEIYTNCEFKELPTLPTDKGAKDKLSDILRLLRDNPITNDIYNKYVPKEYRSGIKRALMCQNAIDWSCEKTLKEILSGDRYCVDEKSSDNIEEIISLLQNIISYNIPLLLKPIFDIKDPENIFLLCLQTGAYKKLTRKMIEMGIPRETTLFLNDKLFSKTLVDDKTDEEVEEVIRKKIVGNMNDLPYWVRVQLEFIQ